jgi:hypothetical protein
VTGKGRGKRALTRGIDKDGNRLNPPMGFSCYADMADADLDNLIVWLRTLPPQDEALFHDQRASAGSPARMRCENSGSGALSAACAASLISERRRSSSNGSVVSRRPE